MATINKTQMIENTMTKYKLSKDEATKKVNALLVAIATAPIRSTKLGDSTPYWADVDESRPFSSISTGLYGGMGSSYEGPIFTQALRANQDLFTEAGFFIYEFNEGGGIGGYGVTLTIQSDKLDKRFAEMTAGITL